MRNVASTLFAFLLLTGVVHAERSFNLTPGVSTISHDVYDLHMTVFWICVVIGVVVFGAMFYSIINHRKSKGAVPADFHSHPVLEITWTIIPAVILIVMAIPASKVLFNMNNNDREDLTVKITGYQWKWHYEYLEDGVSFFSNLSTPVDQMRNQAPKTEHYLREVDKPLVLPIHKKVRFLITSNDVNHAWWVPEFAVKRDAIAGFINEAWTRIDRPGTYRGQCAELCGINHAFMPIVVIATTEQGYKDWVAKQKGQASQGEAETNREWTMDQLMEKGHEVYARICAACHQPDGKGLPPTFPALKGSAVATGPIEKHVQTVVNGVSGTAMQAFKNQLNDVELAAVITFERNAFDNKTGSLIQPIQVKTYKEGKSMTEALAIKPSSAPTNSPTGGNKNPVEAQSQTEPQKASQATQAEQAVQKPVVPSAVAPETPVAPVASTPASGEKPITPPNATQPTTAATSQTSEADLKEAMQRGEKIYLNTCAACHQPAGTGMPPTFPALKGDKKILDSKDYHLDTVLNGKQGTAMMAFKNQYNDQDLADVITYERNAWGNNTGDHIKSEDVKTFREQKAKQ